jgi:hypothetical protein
MADTGSSGKLVSIQDVALHWRTGVEAVRDLVSSGLIPSLDGGELARAGLTAVPCMREAWAESARVSSPGSGRRIDDPWGDHLHPAAARALDFYNALSDGNAQSVWDMSSTASREAFQAEPLLLEAWRDLLGGALAAPAAITTGVYDLAPHSGVGIRLTLDAPLMPERIDVPTPMRMAGVIALVQERGSWFADITVAGADEDWSALLASPVE